MKKIKSYLFWMIMAAFSSCMQPVVWEDGDMVTRYIRTTDCDTIEFRGIFSVLLVQDTTAFVKIICGENLIDNVRTHQKSRYIEISEINRMNWTRNYKRTFVEIHFIRIQHICIHEGVRMVTSCLLKSPFLSIWDVSGLSETDLEISCTGFKLSVSDDNTGIYNISGDTGYTCLEADGSAHFRLENLVTDSCHIQHKGTGNCRVNVTRVLEGEIDGKGTIQYKNYPGLRVNLLSGKGRVISQP